MPHGIFWESVMRNKFNFGAALSKNVFRQCSFAAWSYLSPTTWKTIQVLGISGLYAIPKPHATWDLLRNSDEKCFIFGAALSKTAFLQCSLVAWSRLSPSTLIIFRYILSLCNSNQHLSPQKWYIEGLGPLLC